MRMMNKRIDCFFRGLQLLLGVWCLLLASCEDLSAPGKEMNVTVEVDTRAESVPAFESVVNSMDVLVFDQSTQLLEHTLSLTAPFLSSYSLTLKSGTKLFYVIGNKEPRISSLLSGVVVGTTTVTDFETDADAVWTLRPDYEVASSSMPFTCIREFTPIVGTDPVVSLALERIFGKLQFTLLKDAAVADPVYLRSVKVVRTPDKSSLMQWEVPPLQSSDLTLLERSWSTNPPEIHSNINPNNAFRLTPWYLYEYRVDDGYSLPAEEESTALEVTFTIGGYQKMAVIPLVSYIDAGSGKHRYCVRRNTIAFVNAIIKQGQIEVSYSVFDWKDGDEFEKETGEDESNKNIYDWEEGTLPDDGEFELSYN